MPAAQYYGIFCVIDFVQILPVHQAAPWVAGKGELKGGTSNYTLPASGLFFLPSVVRQCTGLSARADSDEFHITIYITTMKANYDIWADFLTFRSSSLDEQFLGRGAGGGGDTQ